MTITTLTAICLSLSALCAFLMLRLTRVAGSAQIHESRSQEQALEIKKLKERLKKTDKKAQAKGQGHARDDRKIQTLQESVNNLRKELADARKVARTAEKRREEALHQARLERQEIEEHTPAPVVTPEVEHVAEKNEGSDAPEPRAPDEGALQQKVSSLAHSEDHLKKEVTKLSESLKEQQKRYQDGRHEWAKARRKYEDLRRAYIITKGQLDITQDMLSALEAHTGKSASDGLLAQSGRAKKRQEIQKHRAEQKTQSEMPEAAH